MSTYDTSAVREARMALMREIGLEPIAISDEDVEITFGHFTTMRLTHFITNEWAARWANPLGVGLNDNHKDA